MPELVKFGRLWPIFDMVSSDFCVRLAIPSHRMIIESGCLLGGGLGLGAWP